MDGCLTKIELVGPAACVGVDVSVLIASGDAKNFRISSFCPTSKVLQYSCNLEAAVSSQTSISDSSATACVSKYVSCCASTRSFALNSGDKALNLSSQILSSATGSTLF